jgi:hypothetical protein
MSPEYGVTYLSGRTLAFGFHIIAPRSQRETPLDERLDCESRLLEVLVGWRAPVRYYGPGLAFQFSIVARSSACW